MSSNLVIPENELPTWMKQAQRGVDWGAILVLGFCFLVAWPFLAQEGISTFNNSEHYVYRTADYAEAFKDGHLYPRWSPHSIGGYGAEVPNYYPPGAAYTAAIIEVLFTNDSIAAVRLTYAISFLIAGSMVYAFVKQHTNALSAIFASLLYIFSPFVALAVPHVQGDLGLAFSIAFLPMFLWAINRLMMRNHILDYVLIASVCAAIIITKPIMLIQAVLLAIVLFAVYFQRQAEWRKLGLTLSAIIAGIGLAAFYWMPALLERGFVKWSKPLLNAPENHLNLRDFFARTQLFDTNILVSDVQFNIGWLILGFTILTIITLIYWRKNILFPLVFLITGIVLSILGLTLFSKNTELLAGIVLCFAVASSYPISILPKNHIGIALAALALIFVFMGTLPIWNMPEPPLVVTSDTMVSQQEYENNGWGIAVLAPSQAIPSFVSPTNQNLPASASNINSGRILSQANFQSTLIEEGLFGERYRLITKEETRIDNIHYLRAYSIGWKAFLNEQALEISADNNGLIEVIMPEGLLISTRDNIILSFRYGTTPIRITSEIISAISIVLIVGITWQRWQNIEFSFDSSDLLTRTQLIIVVILLAIGILQRYSPTREFLNDYISYPISDITQDATSIQNKIDELELWRFSFENRPYQAGEILELQLFWELHNAIESQHQIRIRMISRESQKTIVISPFQYPKQLPSNRWPANLTVLDAYKIQIPQDLESGSYTIMVDVSSCPDICLQGSIISSQTITTIQLPQSLIIK